MANAASAKPPGKSGLIVTLGALTVLAAAGGGIVGKMIGAKAHAGAMAGAVASPEAAKALPYAVTTEVRELPPIITNLAEPAEARVRMQVSIVYDKGAIANPSLVAAQINDDIITFLKTLRVSQIQGASGLQGLREDLDERAATRSGGRVREVIIETLVVQ